MALWQGLNIHAKPLSKRAKQIPQGYAKFHDAALNKHRRLFNDNSINQNTQLTLKHPIFVSKKIWGASQRTRLSTSTN